MPPARAKCLDLFLLLVVVDANLVQQLQSITFLNSGTTAWRHDNLTYTYQCNGFSEDRVLWTQWSARQYLYNSTPAGLQPPAFGLRSALPLGGLGTGSFELRADGTFADWTIENQGTALAADSTFNSKLPLKDEMFMALWAAPVAADLGADGGPTGASAFALRTAALSASDGTPIPLVDSLTYSAAFPFARLTAEDARLPQGLQASVYAYSPLKLWDSNGSAVPAVIFTMVLDNSAGGSVDVNASFLLHAPLGMDKDTNRPLAPRSGNDPRGQILTTITDVTDVQCMQACADNPACAWYTHSGSGVPPTPDQVIADHDCPGNYLYPRPPPVATVQECAAACMRIPGNVSHAAVFDQIPSDQPQQCNNSAGSGVYCCLCKSDCGSFIGKDGDTVWIMGDPGVAGNVCILGSKAPPVQQFVLSPTSNSSWTGPRSGIKGMWSGVSTGQGGLNHARQNDLDSSPEAAFQDPASALGDYTLAGAGDASSTVSVAWGNDIAALWSSFASTGSLATVAPAQPSMAAYGAIAVNSVVAAGTVKNVSIVFSWYIPNRLYIGQAVGNQYAQRYTDSVQVATTVLQNMDGIVADGAAWNTACTNNTLPEWYQDLLVNSISSQVKMSVWVVNGTIGRPVPAMYGAAPGRFRQYEAFSNCDLDPVHVSSYHAVPYITFWPDLSANTLLTGWAAEQQSDGMVQELLGNFGAPGGSVFPSGRLTGAMDSSAGGREMADVSTVFILWSLAVHQSTGNTAWLQAMYPSLLRAAQWQINRTVAGPNGTFPAHLQNTYDYLGLDQYPMQSYTGFLHIAAMRAIRVIAQLVGDGSGNITSLALQAEQIVSDTMQTALWTGDNNPSGAFFRAWQTDIPWSAPDVPMTGTTHGQSWAAVTGLGWIVNQTQLATHISAELRFNCAYNLSDCWLGPLTLAGAPDVTWATDATPAQSMDHSTAAALLYGTQSLQGSPAERVTELYRSQLNDFFNIHDLHVGPSGLTCSNGPPGQPLLQGAQLAGTPFVNAHYARHVQGWAIQRALTGQLWDASTRTLSFSPPVLREGEILPWFTSQAVGTLALAGHETQDAGRTWTLHLRVSHGCMQISELHVQTRAMPTGSDSAVPVSGAASQLLLCALSGSEASQHLNMPLQLGKSVS